MTDKNQINAGGAAFPVTYEGGNNNGDSPFFHQGMTLRDYFAAKALQGLLANPSSNYNDISHLDWPSRCYQIADAMLVTRGGAQ